MQIAIITVKRTPPYILNTIESIQRTAPKLYLDLFVDGWDHSDVEPWQTNPAFRIHRASPTLLALGALDSGRSAAVNYMQALLDRVDEHLIIFEDDIELKPGWLAYAERFLASFDAGDEPGVMTLYACQGAAQELAAKNIGVHEIPAVCFYGTLGMVIPSTVRARMAAFYFDRVFNSRDRVSPDTTMREFLMKSNVRLYASNPSYVDHRGDVSTLHPAHGARRSPLF